MQITDDAWQGFWTATFFWVVVGVLLLLPTCSRTSLAPYVDREETCVVKSTPAEGPHIVKCYPDREVGQGE